MNEIGNNETRNVEITRNEERRNEGITAENHSPHDVDFFGVCV